jgi:flagellar biosynthesis protein FlhF
MIYREVIAETYDQAFIKIKKEYGDSARIVKKDDFHKGGFLGLGRKRFVKVLVSIPDVEFLDNYRKKMGTGKKVSKQVEEQVSVASLTQDQPYDVIMQKLAQIEDRLAGSPASNEPVVHPNLAEVQEILKENEFFDDFIDRVTTELRENLTSVQLDDRLQVQQYVYDLVSTRLRIEGGISFGLEKQKVIVLVGPTGVGKTTTVAKIAANALRERLQVELVSIDGFRIGARDQLNKYADLMNVSVSGPDNADELKKVLSVSTANVILVDTIGRGPNDDLNLARMKQILDTSLFETEFVMVLSATAKARDVKKLFKSFDLFDYNNIIITKLDESDTIGSVLNMAISMDKGIRYLTTGQKVPNDIEKATVVSIMEKIRGFLPDVYLNRVS